MAYAAGHSTRVGWGRAGELGGGLPPRWGGRAGGPAGGVVEPLAAGDPGLIGPFRLRGRLGAGGMGRVFLGFSPAGRPVAVKVVHPELAADPAFRARFAREVAAARAVSGAYTAPVLAAGPGDDPPWLATMFVAGPWLAEALAEIHGRGLVHRDLKPANVLLAIDGPRVIDFGISRALEATVMTATGLVVGTPSFMSPEQAGGGAVGAASDVFSLGCLIVFAAAGCGPFGDGPVASLLYRVVHAEPALGRVPGGLRELAAACLAKDPAARPALAQVIAAITAGSAPAPPAAPPAGQPAAAAAPPPPAAPPAPPRPDEPTATSPPSPVPVTPQYPAAAPQYPAAAPQYPAAAPQYPMAAQQYPMAAQQYQAAAPGPAGPAFPVPAPGLPADLARGGGRVPGPGPSEPSRPTGRPPSGLTRRRALAGLAGAATAIGLAAAGWELTRDHTPPPRPGTVIWRTGAGGGPYYYRPAIGRDVVYFPGSTDRGQNPGPLVAVRADDGATIWTSHLGGGVNTLLALAGDVICFGGNDNNLYAVRASDGTWIWDAGMEGGLGTDPVAAGGVIYFGGGSTWAVGASDGSTIWSIGLGGGALTDPVAAGDMICFGASDDTVYRVRASDGTHLWDTGLGGGPDSDTAPALAGGVMYYSGADHKLHAVRASDGAPIWATGLGGTVTDPAPSGGIICFGGSDHKLHAVRASDGTPIWATGLGGGPDTYPAAAGGVVYFGGSDNRLHAVRADNGTPLWNHPIPGGLTTDPTVAGGVVYFGSGDGRLY